jgi:hypothetical protein
MLERIPISDTRTFQHLTDRLKPLYNLQKGISLMPIPVRCLDFLCLKPRMPSLSSNLTQYMPGGSSGLLGSLQVTSKAAADEDLIRMGISSSDICNAIGNRISLVANRPHIGFPEYGHHATIQGQNRVQV